MTGERAEWPGPLVGIYQVVQMVFYVFKNWYGCTHMYRYGWALPRWEKIEPSPCFLRVIANESFPIHQETWAQVPLLLYLHRSTESLVIVSGVMFLQLPPSNSTKMSFAWPEARSRFHFIPQHTHHDLCTPCCLPCGQYPIRGDYNFSFFFFFGFGSGLNSHWGI